MDLSNNREFFELNGWMRHFLFDEDATTNDQSVLSTALRYVALKHKDINKNPAIFTTAYGIKGAVSLERTFSNVEKNATTELWILYQSELPTSNIPAGWVYLHGTPFPVSEMLSTTYKTRCFINYEAKKCIVFTEGLFKPCSEWEQKLTSVLFRLLPWRFPEKIDQEDEEYFKGLYKADETSLLRVKAIEHDVIERGGWRELCYKRLADKLLTESSKAVIAEYTMLETTHYDRIKRLIEELTSEQENLREVQCILKNMRLGSSQRSDELLQGLKNKSVQILNTKPDGLLLAICDTMDYYDEDEFHRLEQRRESYFYSFDHFTQRVLHGIFAENLGTFKVSSVFRFNSTSLVPTDRGFYTTELINNFLPNPHLYFYQCLGGNAAPIQEFIVKGEYDAAIQQAVAATKNINFADSTVIQSLADWISCIPCKDRCIIARDGTEMTIQQFHDTYCKDFKIVPTQS